MCLFASVHACRISFISDPSAEEQHLTKIRIKAQEGSPSLLRQDSGTVHMHQCGSSAPLGGTSGASVGGMHWPFFSSLLSIQPFDLWQTLRQTAVLQGTATLRLEWAHRAREGESLDVIRDYIKTLPIHFPAVLFSETRHQILQIGFIPSAIDGMETR